MNAISLAELAALVSGSAVGDPDLMITGAAIIRDAVSGEISLAESELLIAKLADSGASAAVVPEGSDCQLPSIHVGNVSAAFEQIVQYFHPPRVTTSPGISPRAFIHPSAQLAEDVDIHAGAYIGEDVQIGTGSVIHSGVRIMAGCSVGREAIIFPNAVLYENSRLGDRVIVHAGAVIGAYGFGYQTVDGCHQLSAQLGFVVIEDDVEIGSLSTIDRGTYGATTIGAGTKIDNQVMIAHNCRIGRHNLLCSQVGIAGSSTTGDHVVMAGQVGIRDHVDIGQGVVLGAQSGVMNHIPAGATYFGSPAAPEREQLLMFAATAKLPAMRKEFRKLQRRVEELEALLTARDDVAGFDDASAAQSDAA